MSLPELDDQEQILEVHARDKMEEGVDLNLLARGTQVDGADLSNLINEAALIAVRGGIPPSTVDILNKHETES